MERTPGRACASHEAQCVRSNEIVAAASSDDVGRHLDCPSGTANLCWVLIHFVEETGRHTGHADIVRELLDGAKGYY
ncbi:mycothiol transferase [Streptomyces radiopugnans]|uniref:mycothiol transferase n=1 Tax=Streptomyces radiopugnans TaxID=403935 RepID=UPI003F1B7275